MTEEQHAEAILRAARCTLQLEHFTESERAAILTALRAYGDERAADMRERAAGVARDCAIFDGDHLINTDIRATCAQAIRALPLQEPKKAPATVIERDEPFGRESGLRPGFYEDDMP